MSWKKFKVFLIKLLKKNKYIDAVMHLFPFFFGFNMFFKEEQDYIECFHFYYMHNFCAYFVRGFCDKIGFFSFPRDFTIDFASAYYRNTFIYLYPRIEIKLVQKFLEYFNIEERLYNAVFINTNEFLMWFCGYLIEKIVDFLDGYK